MQLLEDVRALKPACSGEPGSGGGCSVGALARALAGQGYLVSMREAQPRECGKACGRACLEKLQHTYIVVSGSLDSAVTVCGLIQQTCAGSASHAFCQCASVLADYQVLSDLC